MPTETFLNYMQMFIWQNCFTIHQTLTKIFCKFFYLQNFLQTENRLHQRIWIISEVTSENMDLFLEQGIIFHNNVFSTTAWTTSDLTSTFCSGVQTLGKSLKLPWSSTRYWTTVVKNLYCKNLTMKFKVKYLFQTF